MTAASRGWRRFLSDDLLPAVGPWVLARLTVGAALALSRYLFDHVGSGARPDALSQGLFAGDAAYYRGLAEHGYGTAPRSALRFFPLVSLLARWLGTVLAGHREIALLVVANGSALVFAALLHRLTLRETRDPALARRAVWWAALLPPAMALVLGYAEATMMALAVGAFLALRTRRFELAALLGVLAGLTRPVGVFLVVPAAIEAARGWDITGRTARARRVLAVLGPLAGAGAYLAWVGATRGDALLPLRVQEQASLRGRVVDPVSRLAEGIRDLAGGDRIGSGLHVVWAALFLALLVVVARRLPASYTAYAAVGVVVALSARNLDSFERYAVSTFPIVVGVALVTGRDEVQRGALVLAGAAMLGYATLLFLGQYVL